MYRSPIEIMQLSDAFYRQQEDVQNKAVYSTVLKYGINVDKEELLKALKYDRGQYKKGYDDGYEGGIKDFAEKLKEYYPSIANGIDYTAEEVLKG